MSQAAEDRVVWVFAVPVVRGRTLGGGEESRDDGRACWPM